jgi:transmembrane sensor
MNYSLYEPEDFALDAFFCSWVLEPTTENEAFWLEWLHNNPGKSRDIEVARQLVLLASSDVGLPPSPETVDRIWKGIEDGRQSEIFVPQNRRLWLKIAASVALLVIAFTGYLYKRDQTHTYRTAFGESRRLLMPDGSQVTLNANSTLRIPGQWGQSSEREVWLEGEAFFHVNKIRKAGQATKFVVHTHDLNVEVKGTQFNVNTRKNQTQVVLSEGLVHLYLNGNKSGKKIRMNPGDLVDFSAHNQKLSIQHLSDATAAFSWKNNRWTLNDTSLEEISILIQETYGITVIIANDSLRQQKVTGIVPTDNIDDLLGSLESILPITITRKENKITIEKH